MKCKVVSLPVDLELKHPNFLYINEYSFNMNLREDRNVGGRKNSIYQSSDSKMSEESIKTPTRPVRQHSTLQNLFSNESTKNMILNEPKKDAKEVRIDIKVIPPTPDDETNKNSNNSNNTKIPLKVQTKIQLNRQNSTRSFSVTRVDSDLKNNNNQPTQL